MMAYEPHMATYGFGVFPDDPVECCRVIVIGDVLALVQEMTNNREEAGRPSPLKVPMHQVLEDHPGSSCTGRSWVLAQQIIELPHVTEPVTEDSFAALFEDVRRGNLPLGPRAIRWQRRHSNHVVEGICDTFSVLEEFGQVLKRHLADLSYDLAMVQTHVAVGQEQGSGRCAIQDIHEPQCLLVRNQGAGLETAAAETLISRIPLRELSHAWSTCEKDHGLM